MFQLAIKNLFQDKGKLLLSIGGTAFAIVLMVILQAILSGTIFQARAYSENTGADIFVTQDGVSKMLASISFLPENIKGNIENVAGVKQAIPIYGNKFCFNVGNKVASAYIVGYDPKNKIGGPWKVSKGSDTVSDKEVILDEFLANSNNIKIGDSIELSNEYFKVVGLSSETNAMANQYIFVTKKDASRLLLSPNVVNFILVTVDDYSNSEQIAKSIENQISSVNAYTKEEFAAYNQQVQEEMISAPMKLMVGISFFIGLMIIGLTIYTSTLSKYREYAILKAVGASNSNLYSTVFFQALINSILGFGAGLVASFGVSKLINSLGEGVSAALEPQILFQSFIMALFMSLFASYIPIRKVALIDPATVFK